MPNKPYRLQIVSMGDNKITGKCYVEIAARENIFKTLLRFTYDRHNGSLTYDHVDDDINTYGEPRIVAIEAIHAIDNRPNKSLFWR